MSNNLLDPVMAIRVRRPSLGDHNQAAKHRADFQRCPCTDCEQQASCQAECGAFRQYVKRG